jgi:hypothetical protein
LQSKGAFAAIIAAEPITMTADDDYDEDVVQLKDRELKEE